MRISQAPSLDIMKASVLSAHGDILIRGAAVPERLGAGTTGYSLNTKGAGADPVWEDILGIMTTRGDIIQRGAVIPERLAAGIMDKMLVSNGPGANLTWEYNNIFMDINNVAYRIKILDIGVWNMNNTDVKDVVHGFGDIRTILNITVMIYHDSTSFMYPLNCVSAGTGDVQGGIVALNVTEINLTRKVGGFFNDPAFNDPVMNRGKVFITYLM